MGSAGDGRILRDESGHILQRSTGKVATRGSGSCECCAGECPAPEGEPDWIDVELIGVRFCDYADVVTFDFADTQYGWCFDYEYGTLPGGAPCISSATPQYCEYTLTQKIYKTRSIAITGGIRLDRLGANYYEGTVTDAYEETTRTVQTCDDSCAATCGETTNCAPGSNYDTTEHYFADVLFTASCTDGEWSISVTVPDRSLTLFSGSGRASLVVGDDFPYLCELPEGSETTISCSCTETVVESGSYGEITNDAVTTLCDGTVIVHQDYEPDPSETYSRTTRYIKTPASTGGGYATVTLGP